MYNTGYAYPEKIGFCDDKGNPLDINGNITNPANQYILRYSDYENLTEKEQRIFDLFKIYCGESINTDINLQCPIPQLSATPKTLIFNWDGTPINSNYITIKMLNTSSPNDEWTVELTSPKPSWIHSIIKLNDKIEVVVNSARIGDPEVSYNGINIKSINPVNLNAGTIIIKRMAAPLPLGFKWIPDGDSGSYCETN